MNRLCLIIIAGILTLSTLYGSIGLRLDGKVNSALMDFTEESEGEIESIDLRLLMIQEIAQNWLERSVDETTISYSENLVYVRFPEVPIPPPKG